MSTALMSLTNTLAARFGMGDAGEEVMHTLKSTAFKVPATDAQMTALLIVANQYGLNPWTREIYAFPDKGGIVPVVGVDGWSRIINTDPAFDGMEFRQDDESCTCIIYRKDRAHPISVTEWMSECKRNTQPWQSHPKRMLRHKAMIQAARLAFGFSGIFDQDEAERIIEKDVTPGSTMARAREGEADNPRRADLIATAEAIALQGDVDAMREHFKALPKDDRQIIGVDEMTRLGKLAAEHAPIEAEYTKE